ncbi:MAG: 30S ribosomal protein S17e [Candidatus Pacearchaeota archaeon]|jgi:ribosomal protein S17E
MGRIKSTLIKRTARTLVKENSGFSGNFDHNKKVLEQYTLPDKGTRNKVAGYIVRIKRAGNVPKPRKVIAKDE